MRILYFAYLVDKLGRASEELALPDGVRTVGALLGLLRSRGGVWTQALADHQVQVMVNRAFVSLGDPVAPGDEVAIVSKTRG